MAILAPNPSHSPFLLQRHAPNQKNPSLLFANSPSNKFKTITHFSSPSPTPLVTQEEDSSVLSPSPPAAVVGCKTCGREEIEKGCNGEGRIQGGIATVPGFGWWPIKAYRPCPGFTASGGRYRRRGQSMDEVASGQKRDVALKSSQGESESVSSKKKREKK